MLELANHGVGIIERYLRCHNIKRTNSARYGTTRYYVLRIYGTVGTVPERDIKFAYGTGTTVPLCRMVVPVVRKKSDTWYLTVCAPYIRRMGDSAYSFSLTTFSPSGKLVQIEYALNAVASGSTSLGVKAKNGVVIATEKKLPTCLIDETSMQKVVMLTENIAVVYSGMGPDFRVLCRKGRKAAQQYFRVYREIIPVSMLTRELAAVMQEFTQRGGVRPFGISLLLAGFDHNGPQLYQIDPSGSYFAWKASAIGKHMVNAKVCIAEMCLGER